MQNSRFSISIHILTLLAKAPGELLSSEHIAGSININPVLVRRELANLRRHGMILSREGKHGGVGLAMKPEEIMLSEVYSTVKVSDLLGKSRNKPNPSCRVGKQINTHLMTLFNDAEKALLAELGKTSLKKFSGRFK